ncbi:MAG TPA: energy-coupling factor transporter ATPase [Bacillota bacterium]
MITIEGLGHLYNQGQPNEVAALVDVNLTIEAGRFVAVVGPNGSGKSTLAKHLDALLLPTSGRVTVGGIDTHDQDRLWEIRRLCGMVFQNPDNQIVATTVEEDVAFGPENLGVPSAEIGRRIDEALRWVGMQDLRDRAPHLLSGGQKQRVAIAGVLAMRPRCLVLDEATAMLDPAGREEVMAVVRRLNREDGLTVLHITHFMDEAAEADQVVVMDRGRIQFSGPPHEVFSRAGELRKIGLDVPAMTELGERLRKAGFNLPAGIVSVDEMVGLLCR